MQHTAGVNVDAKTLGTIIKAQSAFRGLLTRRRIKKQYGFECKTVGMFNRRNNLIEMDPEKLDEQRKKVQELRNSLPPFAYDEDPSPEEGVDLETRDMQLLPDNA